MRRICRLFSRLARFLARLWGTRDALAFSFVGRCRIVWATTWRHCWSYTDLRRRIGSADRADMSRTIRQIEADRRGGLPS